MKKHSSKALQRHPLRLVLALSLASVALFSCTDTLAPADDLKDQAFTSATTEVRIVDGLDDAQEYTSGSVNRSSTNLNPGLHPTVALRFNGVVIPQGASITSAYIQFKTGKAGAVASSLAIQGQATDNALALLSQAFNLSSRPKTAAVVPWSPVSWLTVGESGPAQRTPNIAAVVQEIVDRPAWASGNSLVVLFTSSGERVAKSYDGDQAGAPLLHVTYSFTANPPGIDSFTADPTAVNKDKPVTFSWHVTDPAGQALRCTLDIDDDGNPEYSFSDCEAVTSQTHSYAAGGAYLARLTVVDSDGATAEATAEINVADTSTTVTVAAAGDIACDPTSSWFDGRNLNHCQMNATSQLMLQMNLTAVLPLGDNAYEEGTLEQFRTSYDPSWGRLKSITYPAVGNHEYLIPGASGYYSYFGAAAGNPAKGYYSFELGNWHIVVLNSSCSQAGGCKSWSPQAQWLRSDLAAHPAPCTLAIWHIPRFSSGRIGNRDFTQDLWTELYTAGADLILTGHDHNYERFAPQTATGQLDQERGLRQFVVGTGGKSVLNGGIPQPNSEAFQNDTPGVLKLTLKPAGYDWQFVPIPGKTFTDSGSSSCH